MESAPEIDSLSERTSAGRGHPVSVSWREGSGPDLRAAPWAPDRCIKFNRTYLLEFILAEKGLVEMFSSMGLFTEGIGLFEMPLS